MASLFDIAGDLSQFDSDDPDARDERAASVPVVVRRQSSLCILDEALQTIYGSRRGATVGSTLSAAKSTEQLEHRMRELGAAATRSTPAMSSSPSRQVADNARGRGVNKDEKEPQAGHGPSTKGDSNSSSNSDADLLAKTTLREVSDEVEQLLELQQSGGASSRDIDTTARFLVEKYIGTRLSKLPGTPFVQLVRKKALQKIQQLQQQQQQSASSTSSSTEDSATSKSSAAAPAPQTSDSKEVWRRLSALTPQQHEMLQKLALVSDAHVPALAAPQQDLVQFARRYTLVRNMSARELARLQPHQQQIVRRLQLATASPTH